MAKPLLNQSELLKQMAQGDQRAFGVIYDHYFAHIYAYALHVLKDTMDAEEVAQESFLKLWKLGAEAANIANAESYLITTARNRALDMLRRGQLEARVRKNQTHTWTEEHHETEEQLELQETRRILQTGVEMLPPQQKAVYQLCHEEGLKYTEAALELGLSVNTVKYYMKIALKFLREHLQKHGHLGIMILIFQLLR